MGAKGAIRQEAKSREQSFKRAVERDEASGYQPDTCSCILRRSSSTCASAAMARARASPSCRFVPAASLQASVLAIDSEASSPADARRSLSRSASVARRATTSASAAPVQDRQLGVDQYLGHFKRL